jgi:hypothetical protein
MTGTHSDISRREIKVELEPSPHHLHSLPFLLDGFHSADESSATRYVERERLAISKYLDEISATAPNLTGPSDEALTYSNLVKQLTATLPKMHQDCRVAVSVAAHNEESLLGQFIRDYSRQSGIRPEEWELTIILNGRYGYVRDDSRNVIEQAVKEASQTGMIVHVLDVELPRTHANLGMARKIINDVTLTRSVERSVQKSPLYIQLEDADNYGFPQNSLRRVIDSFDRHPGLDILERRIIRDPNVLCENDLILFERSLVRLSEFGFFPRMASITNWLHPYEEPLHLFTPRFWCRTFTSGAGTAVTAEAFALVRGSFESASNGDDLYIGNRISLMRGSPTESGVMTNTSTIKALSLEIKTDARRNVRAAINALNRGSFNFVQYDDFADEQASRDVRSLSIADALRESPLREVRRFEELPSEQVLFYMNDMLAYYRDFISAFTKQDADQYLQRYAQLASLHFLGEPGAITWDGTKLVCRDPRLVTERVINTRNFVRARYP